MEKDSPEIMLNKIFMNYNFKYRQSPGLYDSFGIVLLDNSVQFVIYPTELSIV